MVFDALEIGGSASALLSLLHELDYSRYAVSLFLLRWGGPLESELPERVHRLTLWPYHGGQRGLGSRLMRKLTLGLEYARSGALGQRLKLAVCRGRAERWALAQRVAFRRALGMRPVAEHFDVAIAFMEGWSTAYVAHRTIATRKVAWLHLDYRGAELDRSVDEPTYSLFDRIVTVSPQCLEVWQDVFPTMAARGCWIENAVSAKAIRQKGALPAPELDADQADFRIVTVCRLDIKHKGLERAVAACGRLVNAGVDVRWYVVGDGPDRGRLEELIRASGLDRHLILLGARRNPYPYMRAADAFVLPSRYEGKPIVVTEAQLLGCPVLVTAYASARAQVVDGQTGLVFANDDQAFVDGMLRVAANRSLLGKIRQNLGSFSSNAGACVAAFDRMINALLSQESEACPPN